MVNQASTVLIMAGGSRTFLDAAEEVLRRHSPGAPLNYRKITELALQDGLVTSDGRTPEATMRAQMYSDIKRRSVSGKPERFRQFGRGLFGLAVPTDPLGGAISEHNVGVRTKLRTVLADLDPRAFEHLIGLLLSTLGFENVEVTKYSGDGGIDVRATLTVGGVTDVMTAIQVKRWSHNVTGRTVRELRGGLGPQERGLIITLSDFTPDARKEGAAPDRTPITLVDGEQLLRLLIDNDIGVTTRTMPILQLDEASLFPADDEVVDDDSESVEGATPPSRQIGAGYKGSKALAIWPMPGGLHVWMASLDAILRFIAETAPTVDQAVTWIIETFEKVKSVKVARSYLSAVLRSFDLIETQGEQIVVSALGASYLDDPSPDALLAIARSTVAGFDELLEILAVGPRSTEELLVALRERLGVGWETSTQVRCRLHWLENMSKVQENDGKWILVS